MYESGDLGFVLGLHRDTVAVAAHGDHTVLQIGGVGRIDHLRQLLVDPVLRSAGSHGAHFFGGQARRRPPPGLRDMQRLISAERDGMG